MDSFFYSNVTRWDRVLRLVVSGALLAVVFQQSSAALAPLALVTPYLMFTAMTAWDPVYGLWSLIVDAITPRAGRRLKISVHPQP